MGVLQGFGRDHHDRRSVEEPSRARGGLYRAVDGPIKPDLLLAAWLVVLLRDQEDASVAFEWAFSDKGPEAPSQTHRLDMIEAAIGLDSTVKDVIANIGGHMAKSSRSQTTSSIILSTNTLSQTLEHKSEQGTLHLEFKLGQSWLDLRPSWQSEDILPFTVTRYVETTSKLVDLLASNPAWSLKQCLGPTQWDLDAIWKWNHDLPPTYDACMHDIIGTQAQQLQDKVAISSWDGDLTYAQIDRWSTYLAHDLQDAGVRHHDFVPLCFEKSRWTVVAVLAVMKAGATMVMMDPSIPLARLQNMAKQVKAKVMISSELQIPFSKSILPEGRLLVVQEDAFKGSVVSSRPPWLEKVPPSALMYIIFTSGSTGTPKGVKISHRTYTSSAFPRAKAVGYNETSRVLDFASYAFDVSIDSMLLTLANGGCLCIPSDEDRMNDINGVMRRMRINYAGITPSVARILEPDVIKSLDHGLGLGGEAASASDVTRWGQAARIVIGYGPCECTIGCTINSSAATGRDYVSIGQGNGAAMWIVDPNDHNVLLPVGAVGELLVEGPIVGQGYLDDVEKTSAAFIDDPSWLVAGHKPYLGRSGRLYKTGDLGRYDPDGSGGIVFAGRKDTQVKLRGQRVELGEIESQLREKLPQDTNVIAEVVKPNSTGGQPTLVAFVLFNASNARGITDINEVSLESETRERLVQANTAVIQTLPRYMVPTAYIPVNCIPVLISGKTDRKKLREFGVTVDLQTVDAVERQSRNNKELSDQEQHLRDAWSQVLKIDKAKIGANDNFFALGGDSVAAMKLVSLCRSRGLEIAVTNMFDQPTLSALAGVIRECEKAIHAHSAPFSMISRSISSATQEAAQICNVFTSAVEDIYPCTPTQESLITFSLKSEQPYVAQRVARVPLSTPIDVWMSAWEAVVAAHPILRTRVAQLAEPGFQQVVVKEQVAWRHSNDLQAYLRSDGMWRMALGEPLARYAVVENKQDRRWYMVWTVHHVLYDGWSEPLLLQKIASHIKKQSFERGATIKAFVGFVRNTDDAAMQSFWRKDLRGATGPQYPKLPSRDYFPTPTGLVERDVSFTMPPGTPFTMATLLRGAWALVASKHTGSDDVVFGETLTGRDISLPGVEGIVGPLIATIPVRVSVARSSTVESYLQSVQQGMSARVPYLHMGMQNIRKVSQDAQIACETGTGIVIQPDPDYVGNDLGFATGDVVHEALHFNPYPLMLGIGIRNGGFRVCASFDTNLIHVAEMERVLAQLEVTCTRLLVDLSQILGDVICLPDTELEEIWRPNSPAPLALTGSPSRLAAPSDLATGARYPSPIGQWICDPKDPAQLSPLGCVGELWLEGNVLPGECCDTPAWLAAGAGAYPGRAGKVQPTGDLVQMQSDGSIVFVRKKGTTISVQGHSVDLAEVEILLRRHLPRVCRTAVAVKGNKDNASLVILVENDPSAEQVEFLPQSFTVAVSESMAQVQISARLSKSIVEGLYAVDKAARGSLPSHMVPSAYLGVNKIPNQNEQDELNKVVSAISLDKLTELAKGWKAAWKTVASSASLTENERVLRSFWARILKLDEEQIEPENNFFRLGGDSVLGMKLVSSLRAAGHVLSVADIFQYMRLCDAAKRLRIGAAPARKLPTYAPFKTLGDVDVSGFIDGTIQPQLADKTWTVQDLGPVTDAQSLDVEATINKPRTAVQYTMLYMPRALDVQRLVRACRDLTVLHPILRTAFVRASGQLFQAVLDGITIEVESQTISTGLKAHVAALCRSDINTYFHYGSPFTKFFLITHSSGEHCLVIRLSHAQYDGISFPLMLQDLANLYSGSKVSSSPSLLSYLSTSLTPTIRQPSLGYWTALLSSATPSPLPPTSMPVFRSALVPLPVRVFTTEATMLATAWALTLARHLGKQDTLFGIVSAGRSLPLSTTVRGPTYAIMPVYVSFRASQSAKGLLASVAAQVARSTEHGHVNFSAIAAEMGWQGASLGSMVHVQDVDEAIKEDMEFAGVKVGVDAVSPGGEPGGLIKAVSFKRNGQLCVGVVANDALAGLLLDNFKAAVEELASAGDTEIVL